MEEVGRSGKLSDRSEVLLYCSVAISNSESLMGTHDHSTVVETFSFALFLVLHPFSSVFLHKQKLGKSL